MNFLKPYLVALILTGSFVYGGKAAPILDTTVGWNFFDGVEVIGETGFVFPTFGQTFTAPLGTTAIRSFTFWLNDRRNPGAVDFQAHLVRWDGNNPAGPLLYSSAPSTTTDNHGFDGMEEFRFDLPDVQVHSGLAYIAFLTTLDVPDDLTGTAYVGFPGTDSMTGGRAYVNYGTTDVAGVLQGGWAFMQPSIDLAFRAEFTAPETGSINFIACSLLILGVFKARASKLDLKQ